MSVQAPYAPQIPSSLHSLPALNSNGPVGTVSTNTAGGIIAGTVNTMLGGVPGTVVNDANGVSSFFDNISKFFYGYTHANVPTLLSPNEIFDPAYWQAVDGAITNSTNNSVIPVIANTTLTALLEEKYGPGGPNNWITELSKFGTEILFGLILIVLIYAFAKG